MRPRETHIFPFTHLSLVLSTVWNSQAFQWRALTIRTLSLLCVFEVGILSGLGIGGGDSTCLTDFISDCSYRKYWWTSKTTVELEEKDKNQHKYIKIWGGGKRISLSILN